MFRLIYNKKQSPIFSKIIHNEPFTGKKQIRIVRNCMKNWMVQQNKPTTLIPPLDRTKKRQFQILL